MPSPRDLLPPPSDPTPQAAGLVQGTVSTAPASDTDTMAVVIDGREHEIHYWAPRDALPSVGDLAVVGFARTTDLPEPWVIAWWPS